MIVDCAATLLPSIGPANRSLRFGDTPRTPVHPLHRVGRPMKSHTVTLGVFVLLLLSADARAQCRLEGTVLSSAGAPLAEVSVRVTGPELRAPLSTQTDRDGHYAFKDVRAGLRVK